MKLFMLITAIILVVIGGAVVFLKFGESSIYRNFKAEMQEREVVYFDAEEYELELKK